MLHSARAPAAAASFRSSSPCLSVELKYHHESKCASCVGLLHATNSFRPSASLHERCSSVSAYLDPALLLVEWKSGILRAAQSLIVAGCKGRACHCLASARRARLPHNGRDDICRARNDHDHDHIFVQGHTISHVITFSERDLQRPSVWRKCSIQR